MRDLLTKLFTKRMEDFIFTLDKTNTKANLNLKIVDFLKVADDIKGVIKVHFNNKYEPNVALSEEAIDSVFGVNDITALPISININHEGAEFGATTGRPRRCGWFDAVSLRHSIMNSSVSGLCITKLDVLDGLDTIDIRYLCQVKVSGIKLQIMLEKMFLKK